MKKQKRRYTLADILPRYTLTDLFREHEKLLADILPRYTLEYLLREQERLRVKDNVATIDESLEDLEAEIGRELTEDETSAILDIVDEYTPKNDEGNYLVGLLPFDYAWQIYRAKNESFKEKK
jgi:hypothetical protein